MAHHHGATGEVQQRVFQRTQGLHVKVVGGLVKQQHVATFLERERQVEAVALTTGEHAGRLLLVGALEAKRAHIRARRHFHVAHLDEVKAVAHHFPQGFLGVDAATGLVHIAEFDRFTNLEFAAIQRLQPHDGLEQRGLTHTVGANDTHDAVARKREGQSVDQHAVAKALRDVLSLDHHVPQARARWDLDLFKVQLPGLLGLGSHLFVAAQT